MGKTFKAALPSLITIVNKTRFYRSYSGILNAY